MLRVGRSTKCNYAPPSDVLENIVLPKQGWLPSFHMSALITLNHWSFCDPLIEPLNADDIFSIGAAYVGDQDSRLK